MSKTYRDGQMKDTPIVRLRNSKPCKNCTSTTTTTKIPTTTTTSTTSTSTTTTTLFPPIVVAPCDVILNTYNATTKNVVYRYNVNTNALTELFSTPLTNSSSDVAITNDKMWLYAPGLVTEYNITLNPWTISINRTFALPAGTFGAGLVAKDDTHLVIGAAVGNVYELDISGSTAVATLLFSLPAGHIVTGDIFYNQFNGNYFITHHTGVNRFISEYTSTGTVVNSAPIADLGAYGMFSANGKLYLVFNVGTVYEVNPYTLQLTYVQTITGYANSINGAAQSPGCIFTPPPTTTSTSTTSTTAAPGTTTTSTTTTTATPVTTTSTTTTTLPPATTTSTTSTTAPPTTTTTTSTTTTTAPPPTTTTSTTTSSTTSTTTTTAPPPTTTTSTTTSTTTTTLPPPTTTTSTSTSTSTTTLPPVTTTTTTTSTSTTSTSTSTTTSTVTTTLPPGERTYYVSAVGSDSNPGTEALPWRTLTKVNNATLVGGDKVLFQRGSTFAGELIAKRGTTIKPIVYGAYGVGSNPVITGFANVSLVDIGGGVYESATAISTLATCNLVTVNGQVKAMGRYPTTGYLTISSHFNNASVTTAATLPSNFTDGHIVMRKKRWVYDVNRITSNTSTNVIYATLPGSATHYNPADGWGFFIQNHPATLDTFGEWYYNPTTKKLRVYVGANPIPTVRASVVENTITSNGLNVLEDLIIEGANTNGIFFVNETQTVRRCNITQCGKNGIAQSAAFNNYSITNNTITFVNNSPLFFWQGGNSQTIQNNILTDSGLIVGAGDYSDLGQEAIMTAGSDVTITDNTIQRIGYTGIRFSNKTNILVEKNLIDTYCLVKDDGGGIYTWNNGATPNVPVNNIVRQNMVINGIGNAAGSSSTTPEAYGIYLDDNAYNVTCTKNTVAFTYYAFVGHNNHNSIIQENNFYNSHAIALFWKDRQTLANGSAFNLTGMNVQNNVFFGKSGQNSARFWDVDGGTGNSIASFGTFDYNIYSRDINVLYPFFGTGSTNATYATVDTFKPIFGFETNGRQIPNTGERFEYNTTGSNKVVSLDKTYIDPRGVIYPTGNMTLAPYSSVILFDNSAAPTFTQKTYTTGTIAGVSAGYWEYLPEGYSGPSNNSKYPIIFYFHGSGENWSGSGAATLNDLLVNPIPKLIQNGTLPKSFTVNGKTSKFIIICPQMTDAPNATEVQSVIDKILPLYRIDLSRVYFTGLSIGGATVNKYATDTPARAQFVTAVASVSNAYNPGSWQAGETFMINLAQNEVAWWGTHNIDDQTVTVSATNNVYDQILNVNPDIIPRKTIFNNTYPNYPAAPYHDAWTRSYDPAFNFDGAGHNMYQWFLLYQKGVS